MPPFKRKYAYKDPYEDEYIFHQLSNYPDWAKAKLSPVEQKIFLNASSMRKFVSSATADQKRLILAKANIFTITLYVDMNKELPLSLENFNKIYKQFESVEARKKIIDEIIQRNVFAISSREVISFAYLIAQNCHTTYWYVNRDYKKIYESAELVKNKNLSNFDGITDSAKVKDTFNARKYIAKLIASIFESENHLRFHMKMDWVDVIILSILFVHQDTFVYRESICQRMYMYSARSVGGRLASLHREGYVDIDRGEPRRLRYTLAERGMEVYCDYIEKVCHKAIEG